MKSVDEYVPLMCQAHIRGDLDSVRQLMEAHPALESAGPDANHTTWLHCAAEHGQIGLIEYWLRRGWDVNVNIRGYSDDEGMVTPLHRAKDAATTRYLLSQGASINASHRKLGTPLHFAITRAVEPSQRGKRRPFGANTDQIRVLLEAGADPSLVNGEGRGYTPLAWAKYLGRKTAEQVLREAGAPDKGKKSFSRRPKAIKLDLRKDSQVVHDYLARRVREFDSVHHALGGPGKVRMIHIGFNTIQTGWVVVVFDTRADAASDGEWTAQIESHALEMPHWHRAEESSADQPIHLVLPDGSPSKLSADKEVAEPLGEMLKAVVLEARAGGLFDILPKAPNCEFVIEHFDGAFCWPDSDTHGMANRL